MDYQGIAKITAENKLLWKIINSSYDGIFMTDRSGIILYFNEAYLRISGLKRKAILGRNIGELIKTGEIPDACSLEVIRTHSPLTKVIDYYHGVSALVTSIPIFDETGALARIFSNVRDITDLMLLREQLENTKDLNEEYRRRLWQAERTGRDEERMLVFSPVMENIVRLAERVANVSSPVLMQGESGVGKDMLARLIHESGGGFSSGRPFVQINCSAIPEQLLESELFGYEPGAFTGASRKGKSGLFELANDGTLFLDEVGEMPPALQVKLLDVLQTGKVFRLGGTKTVQISTRIIAATNGDLEKMMAEGSFRRDLYYRLSVIPVYIPPLRERRGDIVPLALYFIDRMNRKFNLNKKIAPPAADMMVRYDWPGNVRELRNVVEHMMVMTDGDILAEASLPENIRTAARAKEAAPFAGNGEGQKLRSIVGEVERQTIIRAIAACGSLRSAARELGIDLSTLVRKKKKYGI